MTSRKSSTSRCTESAVEPTRSQNITVMWLRSASAARGKLGASSGLRMTSPEPARFVPHLPQNFAPGASLLPQEGQLTTNADPHWLQNLANSGTSARQLGHCMPHLTDWVDQDSITAIRRPSGARLALLWCDVPRRR